MRARWLRAALAVGLVAAAMPAVAQQQARIQLDLSPAGEVVAKRYFGTPDPQVVALAKRGQELQQRQKMLITAPKLDLVQFATVLRQLEQLQGEMSRRSNDRMLQLLRELSEADRVAFMRGMSNPIPVTAPVKK